MKNPNVGAANGTGRRPGMEGREAEIVFAAARIVGRRGCNLMTTMSPQVVDRRFGAFPAQFGTIETIRRAVLRLRHRWQRDILAASVDAAANAPAGDASPSPWGA
ncbi:MULTISPECIES: hypothetical protein [Xanthomonas]|uniref:hypothetical protein n=1 Tax=Xanthomonas TaxID=338 RepID=UPI001264F733|nr:MULTISPECIES: hypothetical protein [Xanthomonas]MDY4294554.1 hypothetical protein [Xanthomonas sp. LF02-5]MDY4356948.1 hypothetical protein [Xanthomonas sp. LF04-12]UYK80066.1 hypothetical protein NG829_17215 [Xanthomonas sacchari]